MRLPTTFEDVDNSTATLVEISEEVTVQEAIDSYTEDNNVQYASPNYIYQLSENDQKQQYTASFSTNDSTQDYLRQVKATDAWATVQASNHSAIKVVVLDTGVDLAHEDLKNVLSTELSHEVINTDGNYILQTLQGDGYFNGNNVDTSDKLSHGTHVAGIIAAQADNGLGIAGVGSAGDNSTIDLVAVDVFDGYETANPSEPDRMVGATTASIVKGLNYAQDINAKIINISLGGTNRSGEIQDLYMEAACNSAVNNGITIVCAAGNENINDSGVCRTIPSDFTSTISVININGSTNTRASSSNYGNLKDLSAPGVSILSTYDYTSKGIAYAEMTGTSMAAPVVSGIVAMMYSVDNTLTPQKVREIINGTATDIGTSGTDIYTGHGLINAQAAINKVLGVTSHNSNGWCIFR